MVDEEEVLRRAQEFWRGLGAAGDAEGVRLASRTLALAQSAGLVRCPVTARQAAEGRAAECRALWSSRPNLGVQEIAAAVGVGARTVYKALRRGSPEGESGRKTRAYVKRSRFNCCLI